MDGKYGVDQLKIFANAVAQALSVTVKVIHGNLLQLWGLVGVFGVLRNVDFAKMKLELGEVSEVERMDIESSFVTGIDVDDPSLKAKLTEGVSSLDEGIDIVSDGIALVDRGKALIARVCALLGL